MLFTSRRSFGTLVLGLVAAVGMLVASSTPLRASGPPAISGTISIAPVTSQSRVPVTIGLSNVGDSGYYMYGQATSGYLDGNGQFVDTGASEVYLEDGPIPTSGSSMTLYAVTGNKGGSDTHIRVNVAVIDNNFNSFGGDVAQALWAD